MITILHGDDIAASRNFYKTVSKKDQPVFDGEKLSVEDIKNALQTTTLFGENKTISIENFFSKRKSSKEMEAIISYLKESQQEHGIIFWESNLLTKKQLSALPNAVIKVYTFPQSLFLFLEALQPENTKSILHLYQKTLQHTDAELILVMLIRQIRLLLALSDESPDPIEEVKRMAPWQKKKLLLQSHRFPVEKLQHLHKQLFEIDVKSKTGGLSLPMNETIDFFIASI